MQKETADSDRFFHNRLFKVIRFIEDSILIVGAVAHLLLLRLNPPDDLIFNRWTLTCLILSIYFVVARIDLSDRSTRMKWSILFLCIMLLTVAYVSGMRQIITPLYALLLARAVLLIEGKPVWWLGLGTFACLLVGTACRMCLWEDPWSNTQFEPGIGLVFLVSLFYHSVWEDGAILALVSFLVYALSLGRKQLLETERLSKEVASMAAELERNRIARDIHDGVGHALTSLSIQLEVARKLLKRDPEKSEQALEQAEKMAKRSLRDIRNAIALIRVENFDLKDAIGSLADDISSGGTMKVETDLHVPELSEVLSFQIFRIVQESCTNAMKHSEANLLKISIAPADSKLCICVHDNGKGMDPNGGSNGFGMTGIKERVDDLEGEYVVTSDATGGTKIEVKLPL